MANSITGSDRKLENSKEQLHSDENGKLSFV